MSDSHLTPETNQPAQRHPGEQRRRQVMGDIFVDRALAQADAAQINFRYSGEGIGIALDQTTSVDDLNAILAVFAQAAGARLIASCSLARFIARLNSSRSPWLPPCCRRWRLKIPRKKARKPTGMRALREPAN